jgi:hypothetical protein
MAAQKTYTITEGNRQQTCTYDELVRRVADRVWKLWQQELRRERERKGPGRR